MEERRDRRQYDAQLTVMDKKHDQRDDTLCEMGCQINRVESKVRRIEKSIYVFMGMLVLINVLWFIPLMGVS
jgi:hypothetical protein